MILKLIFKINQPFQTYLLHAYTALHIPALMFHEACHFVAIFFFIGNVTDVEIEYPKNGKISYGMTIWHSNHDPLANIIISLAPVIGFAILLLIIPLLSLVVSIAILLYISFAYRAFLMSKIDWQSLHKSLDEIRCSNSDKSILKNRFVNQKKINKKRIKK